MRDQIAGTAIMVVIALLFLDRVRRGQKALGALVALPFLALTLGAIWA